MNITLNGGNYVADKTRKAYEDSLNDGFEVAASAAPAPAAKAAPAPVVEKVVEKIVEKIVIKEAAPQLIQQVVESGSVVDSIDKTLQQFYDHQSETLAVHEKYLESPKQYSETFMKLMQQQVDLLDRGADHILDSIER